MDKFENEDALLARYEIHMQMKELYKTFRNFHQFLDCPFAKEHLMVSR